MEEADIVAIRYRERIRERTEVEELLRNAFSFEFEFKFEFEFFACSGDRFETVGSGYRGTCNFGHVFGPFRE